MHEVRKALSGLKMEKASGPDKISYEVLKSFSEVIEKPLSQISNKMIEKVKISPEQGT